MARRLWLAALGTALSALVGAAVYAHDTYLKMTGSDK